ncbi:hypothetical protein CALCODRAFT_504842 [Calocera cornea HHB12733]|uniref:Protein kinase domain-containing protein n=1 Tax=Calocera cornea HHB12733 TaxID=1353952 RepID=A0A165C6H4_9BASI|nr:hypothetical protein CALCODRAFT_504842 [Calocera cornea HHB12733]
MSTSTPRRSARPANPPTSPAVVHPMSNDEPGERLPERRRRLLDSTPIHVVSWADFQEVLPARRYPDIDLVKALEASPANANYKQLPDGADWSSTTDEKAVFAHLGPVCDAIIAACTAAARKHDPKAQATLKFVLQPNLAPHDVSKPDKSRPDIAGMDAEPHPPENDPLFVEAKPLNGRRSPPSYRWIFMSITGEWKLYWKPDLDGRLNDENTQQVVWGLLHQLWTSPDRLYSFAITCEGFHARVWLAHREGVLVSDVIHIHDNKADFLRILATFAFATREDLGWDANMQRLGKGALRDAALTLAKDYWTEFPDEQGPKLWLPIKLEIARKQYVLAALIADGRARAICGSGCRVFLAYELQGSDLCPLRLAIKIVWRNATRDSEAATFAQVKEAVLRLPDVTGEVFNQHFTNISASQDFEGISISKRALRGATIGNCHLITRRQPAPGPVEIVGSHRYSSPGNSEAVGPRKRPRIEPVPAVSSADGPYMLTDRVYSALVMDSVGRPLHHVHNLHKVFKVLAHVSKGQAFLHRAGKAHRDGSPANILVAEEDIGLLMDFEFAKTLFSDEGTHGERTGTPDFMPVEAFKAQFLWRQYGYGETPTPFRWHSGHEIEWHMWIMVWMLYKHVAKDEAGRTEVRAQRTAGLNRIFGPDTAEERKTLLYERTPLADLGLDFEANTTFFTAMRRVAQLALKIVNAHKEMAKKELNQANNLVVWTPVFDESHQACEWLATLFADVETVPLVPPPAEGAQEA